MIRRLLLSATLLLLCFFAAPPPATAFNIFPNSTVCSNNAAQNQSAVCQDRQGSNAPNPVVEKIYNITNIVAFAAGAAAVIVIIVSALKFITSGSDVSTGSRTDTDVENARRSLGNALVGLAIIVLARTLIVFVLSKL